MQPVIALIIGMCLFMLVNTNSGTRNQRHRQLPRRANNQQRSTSNRKRDTADYWLKELPVKKQHDTLLPLHFNLSAAL